MIFLTQLIYIKRGKEEVFDQFEAVAIPLISKYNGKMLLRVKPEPSSFIECNTDQPYEIHLASFPEEKDFINFTKDEERKKFIHLKEESIERVVLIKGNQL